MKTIKNFIFSNCKILLLVGICLIYCLLLLSIWCLGLYSFVFLYSQKELTYGGFIGSSIFWALVLVFLNFYFYYTSVFLTSFSLGIWFYQKEEMDPLSTPLKYLIRYHMGSVIFASLSIFWINFIKFFLFVGQCKQCKLCFFEYIGKCFECIVCCFVGRAEVLFKTLNSYAIIMSTLTGESFIESAKSISHIAFQ